LRRAAKKREVSYRVVAMNSRERQDGRLGRRLGFYSILRMSAATRKSRSSSGLKRGSTKLKRFAWILEKKASIFEQFVPETTQPEYNLESPDYTRLILLVTPRTGILRAGHELTVKVHPLIAELGAASI